MAFGAIKIYPADKWFSLCIREAQDFICQRCKRSMPRGCASLQNSHYHGRANKGVRWDLVNCFALCAGCHAYLESQPYEHTEFVKSVIGEIKYQLLLERKTSTNLGKQRNQENKAGLIAKHYSKQYRTLLARRSAGESGILEFINYV